MILGRGADCLCDSLLSAVRSSLNYWLACLASQRDSVAHPTKQTAQGGSTEWAAAKDS